MEIRPATRKDWPAIKRLIGENEKTLRQDHLPRIKEFFVAVEGKEIVGCAALAIYSPRLAEIRSIAVAERFRKQGVATELVDRCSALAKERGVEEVLAITGAKEFFENRGFQTFRGEKFALLKTVK